MQYTNDALGVSFTLPDSLTVRQQLRHRERILLNAAEDAYTRNWLAALPLISDWQSDDIPDLDEFDLDDATSVKQANIVQWVANIVAGYVFELEDVDPN